MSLTRIVVGALVVASCAGCRSKAGEGTSGSTSVVHLGQPFTGAPAVEISALLANPDELVGRTVRVNGKVVAMCHHKRDWMALSAGATGSGHVRVLTGPAFLVPQDAMRKSASVEGVVEIVEIGEQLAKHFAEGHALGDPKRVTGSVRQIVVRAIGAHLY